MLGSRLHAELPEGAARRTDQVAGALVGVVGVVVVLWILLPTLAHVRGWTSEQARSSRIAREVADHLPNPPDTLEALRRIMGDDPFPQVFDALRPAPEVGAAPGASGLSEETAERVARSTVKVEGEACGRIQEGSGFFVADDVVVTNAHVVAGEDDTDVELSDGSRLDAEVVAFDPNRDLAVLHTEDSDRAPLPVRAAAPRRHRRRVRPPGRRAAGDQPVPGQRPDHGRRHRHLRPQPDRGGRCWCWRRSWRPATRARWSTRRARWWAWPSRWRRTSPGWPTPSPSRS